MSCLDEQRANIILFIHTMAQVCDIYDASIVWNLAVVLLVAITKHSFILPSGAHGYFLRAQ